MALAMLTDGRYHSELRCSTSTAIGTLFSDSALLAYSTRI